VTRLRAWRRLTYLALARARFEPARFSVQKLRRRRRSARCHTGEQRIECLARDPARVTRCSLQRDPPQLPCRSSFVLHGVSSSSPSFSSSGPAVGNTQAVLAFLGSRAIGLGAALLTLCVIVVPEP
jgi:hypothetical protein